jgi:hypothetical protein
MRVVHTALLGMFLLGDTTAQAQLVRVLPPLEGYQLTEVNSISSNGQYIVGCSNGPNGYRATLWGPDRKPRELMGTNAHAVSDDGCVIAGVAGGHAIIWTPSGTIDLGPGRIRAVDAQGSVVAGNLDGPPYRPFCYFTDSGTLVDLLPAEGDSGCYARGLNDVGTLVVGTTHNSSGPRPCIWSSSGGTPLAVFDSPDPSPIAVAVSSDGSVLAGTAHPNNGRTAAVAWVNGEYQVIASWPAGVDAFDVSADGTLILGYFIEPVWELDGPFLFDATHGLRYVRQILIDAGVDMSGTRLEKLIAMSADGRRMVGPGPAYGDRSLEVVLETDCPADFNADFVADFFDYLDFVALYDVQDPRADFNGDQTVDFFDYLDFVAAFEAGCD